MRSKSDGALDRVLRGRRYGGAAGTVAVVALCASLVGMGLLAVAEDEIDLVTGTDANQWRVLDRYVVNEDFVGWNGAVYDGTDANLESWHHRNPATLSGGGIAFPFNSVETNEYTTYLVTYQSMDLTGMSIVATFTIVNDGTTSPVFEAREAPDASPFVRLFFQSTTPDGWSCDDYWWSNGVGYSAILSEVVGRSVTISVSLDPACWSDQWGHFGTYDTDHLAGFADAVANAQEIGLSFGGGSWFANGVALESGAATFQLLSYQILEA